MEMDNEEQEHTLWEETLLVLNFLAARWGAVPPLGLLAWYTMGVGWEFFATLAILLVSCRQSYRAGVGVGLAAKFIPGEEHDLEEDFDENGL